VYAYRGVCRQARKGHDRWQSQISFGGTNHYLGTFDSEWDAAAIYAWAHLILYGEEATQKAQKEGEEAVAAWEQEKKDIKEGKIVAPPPKPEKKKKKVIPKSKQGPGSKGKIMKKKLTSDKKKISLSHSSFDKMSKKEGEESQIKGMISSVPKIAQEYFEQLPTGEDMIWESSKRIIANREQRAQSWTSPSASKFIGDNTVCIPVYNPTAQLPFGCAMLIGLAAEDFSWDIESFLESTRYTSTDDPNYFLSLLRNEYGMDGSNMRFCSVMQGAPCIIGRAGKNLERASLAIGLHGVELGGTIGDIDCNIGGIEHSCNEIAACISFSPSSNSFHFSACNLDDIVTLNGEQINSTMGSFLVQNEAVCSVGSRVFTLVLPSISK